MHVSLLLTWLKCYTLWDEVPQNLTLQLKAVTLFFLMWPRVLIIREIIYILIFVLPQEQYILCNPKPLSWEAVLLHGCYFSAHDRVSVDLPGLTCIHTPLTGSVPWISFLWGTAHPNLSFKGFNEMQCYNSALKNKLK